MGKLSDILNGDGENLRRAWDETEAAGDFKPLPAGDYICRAAKGELFTARSGTPGYKIAFRVLEGEHANRIVWLDAWLTGPALPMVKRDLAKLGVTQLEQLERPLPPGIRCHVRVAQRTADDGATFNVVKAFNAIGIDPPDVDPFAPADSPRRDVPSSSDEAASGPASTSDEPPDVPF